MITLLVKSQKKVRKKTQGKKKKNTTNKTPFVRWHLWALGRNNGFHLSSDALTNVTGQDAEKVLEDFFLSQPLNHYIIYRF